MVLILVTGSTASGKSTISSIVSKLEKCIIIPQDSFYKHDFVDFPYKPGMDDRMERPDSINWGGLLDIVNKNSTISNVIVEGHCILSNKMLVEMADMIIFINTPKEICFERFMKRYSNNLTVEQKELKKNYFNDIGWPSHEKYIENYVKDLVMDNRFYKLPGINGSAEMTVAIIKSFKQ